MAACKSIHHIFNNQLPENQNPSSSSFLDSLSSSWPHIKPSPPPPPHSFTEIFGELHFHDHHLYTMPEVGPHKRNESFSSMNNESLQLCTEGLGFESLDNVDDLKINDNYEVNVSTNSVTKGSLSCKNRCGRYNREFPPPISCISRGRGCVSFESYRENGRFILKEVRIPDNEVLQACRQDGRLRLRFVEYSDQESDCDDDGGGDGDSDVEEIEEDEEEVEDNDR